MNEIENSHEWRRLMNKRATTQAQGDCTDAQYAVYFAPGWEDWQRFRIALKGRTITNKLNYLQQYWNTSDHANPNERLRVSNYLGALLRGGFEEARPMFNAMRSGDI
jgi:hypothetical protein